MRKVLIMSMSKGKYPNTYYRVSIKAIIRNKHGEVLVAKENPKIWNLVGGGMDHGETPDEALRRELYEEACIHESFESRIIGVDSRYLEALEAYYMWIVYELDFKGIVPQYKPGQDTYEVAFINPKTFYESQHLTERMIYKWTVDRTYDIYSTHIAAK